MTARDPLPDFQSFATGVRPINDTMVALTIHARGPNGVGPGPIVPITPLIYAIIPAMIGVAWYNCAEIWIQVFGLFKRHTGLYFWSLLITTFGIILNLIGAVTHYLAPDVNWIVFSFFSIVGWIPMVVGQSLILYSRLHLVVRSPIILRTTLILIIACAILFCVPTSVMLFLSNSPDYTKWEKKFDYVEKTQLCGFLVLETFINGLYIWATVKLLKPSYSVRVRRVMKFLIYGNVVIILLDVIVITMEFTNYYDIQGTLKPLIYSLKVKLEFAVLNQLMAVARRGLTSGGAQKQSSDICGSTRQAVDSTMEGNDDQARRDKVEEQVGSETFGGNLMGSILGSTVAKSEVKGTTATGPYRQPPQKPSQSPTQTANSTALANSSSTTSPSSTTDTKAQTSMEMRTLRSPAEHQHTGRERQDRAAENEVVMPLQAHPPPEKVAGTGASSRERGLNSMDLMLKPVPPLPAEAEADPGADGLRQPDPSHQSDARVLPVQKGNIENDDVEQGGRHTLDGGRINSIVQTFARRRPSVVDFGRGMGPTESADDEDVDDDDESFGLHAFEYSKKRNPNTSWFD